MRRAARSEDDDLACWVGAVTRRWAGRGLSSGQRKLLFSQLLSQLTRTRATTGTTEDLIGSDPTSFADRTARRIFRL